MELTCTATNGMLAKIDTITSPCDASAVDQKKVWEAGGIQEGAFSCAACISPLLIWERQSCVRAHCKAFLLPGFCERVDLSDFERVYVGLEGWPMNIGGGGDWFVDGWVIDEPMGMSVA